MTAIDHIREALHLAAGLLIWPVLLALLLLAALIVIAAGATVRQAIDRWRGKRHSLEAAKTHLHAALISSSSDATAIRLERALQADERKIMRAPTLLKLAVRVGPALGLMGTLIPMAYALQGLASGNLPALASNLVTAFAATVIGLAISITAYLLAAAQDAWAHADVQALALHADQLLAQDNLAPHKEAA